MDPVGIMSYVLVAVIVGIAVIYVVRAVRIVQQSEKALVETFGQFTRIVGPGVTIIFPPVQRIRFVDMREQVIDVPPQDVITKDNVAVTVDAVIYFQVADPMKVLYNVVDFQYASVKLAQTNLRNIVGDMELDQSLTSRETINAKLRSVLDEATDKWGIKVTRVEIQKVEPPQDITAAMSQQMKAEREKRAAILEAEGIRQSAILKAEGAKQAAILQAEGAKQSAILQAEGRAEAIRKVAEAEKYQIEVVYGAIHIGRPTNDLIAVKYLEALAQIAQGQATKIFLPIEASGILGVLGGAVELLKDRTHPTEPTAAMSKGTGK